MKSSTFGQLSLWALLAAGLFYALQATLEPRAILHPFSITALLPGSWWQNPTLFLVLKTVSIAAILCWALHLYTPVSALLASGGLLLLLSNSIAGQIYARHQPYVPAVLLAIYAIWGVSRRAQIKSAPTLWRFGKAAHYPKWVYNLSLLYLTSTYSFAGLSKVIASGAGWVNGVSLQLWCWSGSQSLVPIRAICLYDRWIALGAQTLVLLTELTCVFCFFIHRLRRAYGLALIGFHLSVEVLFGFHFYGNIIAVGLFLMMYPSWIRADKSAH